jgi:hypothetical protein
MVELETVLAPISFNSGEPTRFFGMVQMLSDPMPLLGRSIAYERLVASQLIQEDEPLPSQDHDQAPPAPPSGTAPRSHPRAPYLRLVVSQNGPRALNFGSGDLLRDMSRAIEKLTADPGCLLKLER